MAKHDEAYRKTQEYLEELEKKIAAEYSKAASEMDSEVQKYFAQFQARDAQMQARLQAGDITPQYYQQWRLNQIGRGERMEAMRDKLSGRYADAAQVAQAYINDTTPGIYSLNRNFAAYGIEKACGRDIGFDLLNEQAVRRLIEEEPDIMPYYSPVRARMRGFDLAFGKRQIMKQLTTGILMGESIPKLADRLQNNIPTMLRNSAIRSARTAVTGAQNAGRLKGYLEAEDMGIKLQKCWLATLDDRTRHSHAAIDGETVGVKEYFSNGCMYPGDPQGEPQEVYNCFIGETVVASDSEIVRGYKHGYSGDLVRIETARGVNFTCTPNHPVLTPGGWVAAARLNQGDDLCIAEFGDSGDYRRNPNIKHIYTRLDALFQFFNIILGKRACALGVDFHGDIAAENVEVVTLKRVLRLDRDSGIGQSVKKFLLELANKTFASNSSFMQHLWSICEATFGIVSRCGKGFSFLCRRLGHAKVHRFRLVPGPDSCLSKDSIDDLATESEAFSKFLAGFAGKVSIDKIVSVKIVPSAGRVHVYNLQTGTGYYFVNGSEGIINQPGRKCNGIFAVAHNCRCTMVTQIEGIDTSRAPRRARDPETGRNVIVEGMTYADWVKWKEEKNK